MFSGSDGIKWGRKKDTSSWIFTLNSSWIGDAVTGVGDGLFSGSVRLGVSNKTVETDPEFKKSSPSLSLPKGREERNLLALLLDTWWPLLPHKAQLACSFMGQKGKRLGLFFFLGQTTIGEGESLPNVSSQFNHHNIAGLEQREDIYLTAKSPANALRAFSGISFNKLNKLE